MSGIEANVKLLLDKLEDHDRAFFNFMLSTDKRLMQLQQNVEDIIKQVEGIRSLITEEKKGAGEHCSNGAKVPLSHDRML